MRKFYLVIACVMNISVSYAGGLFDLIGSAVSTVTGNSSEEPKKQTT